MFRIWDIRSTEFLFPFFSGIKWVSPFLGSPLSARMLSIPKKLRSINAFSVSSLVNPPQIRCGTASTWYLFCIAEQIATVPGLFLVLYFALIDHVVQILFSFIYYYFINNVNNFLYCFINNINN